MIRTKVLSILARDWLESPLHPMDCTDLVMAFVREGSWLHVADMYSRDTSSPLRDSWLDGEESLSAAYGYQDGERTVVMFRRRVPGELVIRIPKSHGKIQKLSQPIIHSVQALYLSSLPKENPKRSLRIMAMEVGVQFA